MEATNSSKAQTCAVGNIQQAKVYDMHRTEFDEAIMEASDPKVRTSCQMDQESKVKKSSSKDSIIGRLFTQASGLKFLLVVHISCWKQGPPKLCNPRVKGIERACALQEIEHC